MRQRTCTCTDISRRAICSRALSQWAARAGAPPSHARPVAVVIATVTPHGIVSMATQHHIVMQPTLSQAHGFLFCNTAQLTFSFPQLFFSSSLYSAVHVDFSFCRLFFLLHLMYACTTLQAQSYNLRSIYDQLSANTRRRNSNGQISHHLAVLTLFYQQGRIK